MQALKIQKKLNISIDYDLAEFINTYVQENKTTISNILNLLISSFKHSIEEKYIENNFLNPELYDELLEVKTKLKNGSAQWYSIDEAFTEQ